MDKVTAYLAIPAAVGILTLVSPDLGLLAMLGEVVAINVMVNRRG